MRVNISALSLFKANAERYKVEQAKKYRNKMVEELRAVSQKLGAQLESSSLDPAFVSAGTTYFEAVLQNWLSSSL